MLPDTDVREISRTSQPAQGRPDPPDGRDVMGLPIDAELDATGETCSTLTPLIRARMRGLASGQVLVVSTDDPAAREGVPSWSRLTGNVLLATVEEAGTTARFYLRKR